MEVSIKKLTLVTGLSLGLLVLPVTSASFLIETSIQLLLSFLCLIF